MGLIQRLENLPVSRFHYELLIVTGLGWMFDAMDTGIIAFVLPTLAKAWALSPQEMGLIGSMVNSKNILSSVFENVPKSSKH